MNTGQWSEPDEQTVGGVGRGDEASQGSTLDATWSETVRVARLWKDELARLFGGLRGMLAAGAPYGGGEELHGRTAGRTLARSRHDRMIKGVCGGLAHYLGVHVALVRLVFLALFLAGAVPAVVPYVLLAIVMPEAPLEDASH